MGAANQNDIKTIAFGVVQACTELAHHAQALVERQAAGEGTAPSAPLNRLHHARQLYAQRRIRETVLGADIFSEPGWDILLHLYIEHHEGRQSITSDVQRASRSGPATYRRWLDKLVERNLVGKTPTDGREVFVKLTKEGLEKMDALLASSAQAAGFSLPRI